VRDYIHDGAAIAKCLSGFMCTGGNSPPRKRTGDWAAAARSPRESGRARAGRLFLRFWPLEIILGCFQTGRMSQWAQAHFFVGRDGWRDAGASMPVVPAVEERAGVRVGSCSRAVLGLV